MKKNLGKSNFFVEKEKENSWIEQRKNYLIILCEVLFEGNMYDYNLLLVGESFHFGINLKKNLKECLIHFFLKKYEELEDIHLESPRRCSLHQVEKKFYIF
jgi:hypothetical protein